MPIIFNNFTMKLSCGMSKKTSLLNDIKRGSASQKSNTLCMVRLKKDYLLWIVAEKSDNHSERHCSQMVALKAKIKQKWLKLTNPSDTSFQHDNAWHHIAINVNQHFNEYGWEVLCHLHVYQAQPFQIFTLSSNFKFLWTVQSTLF